MKINSLYKFLLAASLTLLALTLPACRRATDNGKIDGFWQIREIQYNDGNTVRPEYRMIAVQLELLQLDYYNSKITGVLDYHKGDSEIGVDFRYNPTDDNLYLWGFAPDPELSVGTKYCRLKIELLDSKSLILRSPIALITCRRY